MKTCVKCGVEQPAANYCAHKSTRDRLANECKKCSSLRAQAWKTANRDRAAVRDAEAYRANCDARKAAVAQYKRDNPGKVNAMKSARKAHAKKATPAWANQFFIEEAYQLAALRTRQQTGGVSKWHVDHIVPLRSKLVCGLHVENNLEVIPASENCSKSNRYWPDMPEVEYGR